MFAVDHAATALLVKRRYPSVPVVPLLLSVQAMELAWVALNYAGVERTRVDDHVGSVANVHLAYMPFSHSVATAAAAAAVVWWIAAKAGRQAKVGEALAIGVLSHLALDLLTHARDIAVAPGVPVMLGVGLYDRAPLTAFVVVGNALNLSFLAPGIRGPEALLGGRPLLLVTVVLVQIVATLWVVYLLIAPDGRPVATTRGGTPKPASC